MTWQPIETAPRDGTDVLLVWRDVDCMIVAHWEPEYDGPNPYHWEALEGDRYLADAFSHWAPLPEPPNGG